MKSIILILQGVIFLFVLWAANIKEPILDNSINPEMLCLIVATFIVVITCIVSLINQSNNLIRDAKVVVH